MTHDTSDQDVPTLGEMEKLFVNNPDLEEIGAYLGRFNPIKTMGMEQMEIRHSAILAWLLNPQETHGLRDTFLKGFLSAALREHDAPCPSALDVSQADMTDAEVRREWRNIDLLLLSPRNGWFSWSRTSSTVNSIAINLNGTGKLRPRHLKGQRPIVAFKVCF